MKRVSFRVAVQGAAMAGAVAWMALVTGCATAPKEFSSSAATAPTSSDLILKRGDVVAFKFLYHPELDDEQTIRPDGKVSLQLVHDITAEGLTPEQLRSELESGYRDMVQNLEINVVVRKLDSYRVYVGGEVKAPGVLPMQGDLTALGAIIQAGGFINQSADISRVIVVRHRDGKQYTRTLDLRKALKDPDSDPFYLEPFDIVYVPRTAIDQIDQFVDQYINKVIPNHVYYSFTQNVDQQSTRNNSQSLQVQLSPLSSVTAKGR